MVANVLILSSLVVVCQGAGLVDSPIAADVVKYIDSTVVEAKWVATAHTPLPRPRPPPPSNNCVFEKGVDWAGAHNTSSGTAVSGVTSKEDCCSICAADASCFVAVWTGEDQCWKKTKEDCAGGSFKTTRHGRVSCMPKQPRPQPQPQPQQRKQRTPAKYTIDAHVPG
eukprot:gene19023-24361_t